MWNFKAGSKITEDRIKQTNYNEHRKKVRSMKSLMKIREPIQPDFVFAKWKLQMSRRQRRAEIDKHNQILVNKINHIKLADYDANRLRPEAQLLTTLNQHVINLTNDQIIKENKRICQKLLKTHSFYPTTKILDKADELERVAFNISENARRAQSARSLHHMARPKSGYTTVSSAYLRNRQMRSADKYSSNGNLANRNGYQNTEEDSKGKSTRLAYSNSRPESAPTFKKLRKIVYNEQ